MIKGLRWAQLLLRWVLHYLLKRPRPSSWGCNSLSITIVSFCHSDEEENALEIIMISSFHLALNEEVLAMAADEGFWEEGGKVDHDLSQKRAHGPKSHLVSKICKCKLKSIGPFDPVKISSGTLTPLHWVIQMCSMMFTSSFCVSMASRLGVGTGRGLSLTNGLMSSSAGRGFDELEPTLWKLLEDWRTAISPWTE